MKIKETKQNRRAAAGLVATGKMSDCSLESIRAFKSQHPNLWAKEVARAKTRSRAEKIRSLDDRLTCQAKSTRNKPTEHRLRGYPETWVIFCRFAKPQCGSGTRAGYDGSTFGASSGRC